MAGGGKAGQVEADRSDQDAGDRLAHARHRDQSVEGSAKGDEGVAEARLHLAHGSLESVPLGEMQLEQEAVVGGDAPVQGGDEVRARRLEAAVNQVRQALRISLTRHKGLEDGAAADAQDVAEETGEFQVGGLKRNLPLSRHVSGDSRRWRRSARAGG